MAHMIRWKWTKHQTRRTDHGSVTNVASLQKNRPHSDPSIRPHVASLAIGGKLRGQRIAVGCTRIRMCHQYAPGREGGPIIDSERARHIEQAIRPDINTMSNLEVGYPQLMIDEPASMDTDTASYFRTEATQHPRAPPWVR